MTNSNNTEIQSFYQDCGVFITGGTGTLGKLTIEKILRSCPGVKQVYILIRPKKRLSVEDRKKALLENVVFDRMKSEQPGSVEKIVFVPGDCSSPRLGLSDSDYHDLTQHVNIVLHLAATLRFDESLKTAVDINVKGTQEVIALCHSCNFIKAAVFVSTAYSNCIHSEVKEEFYDPPIDVDHMFALVDKFSSSELDVLTPKITGAWPNTYVFSKALSENVILRQCKGIPASIVRPSIVFTTLKEPVPGWIDNIYGPIAIMLGVGCGILHVNYAEEKVLLDMVPADFAVNCILAAAPSSSIRTCEGIGIFNAATSVSNGITVENLIKPLKKMMIELPFKPCVWYPYLINVANYKVYMVLALFLHFLKGCLLDFALGMIGKRRMLLKMYRKIHNHMLSVSYFSIQNFVISSQNMETLYNQLDSKDKEIFLFDMKSICWDEYSQSSYVEGRKYVLNGFFSSTESNRNHLRRLYIVHIFLKTFFFGLILWTVWCVLKSSLRNFSVSWEKNY